MFYNVNIKIGTARLANAVSKILAHSLSFNESNSSPVTFYITTPKNTERPMIIIPISINSNNSNIMIVF